MIFRRPDPQPVPVQPMKLAPGTGTTTSYQPSLGYIVSAPANRSSFAHPFRAALGVGIVRFAAGLIEGKEPVIGERPMSQTELRLDAAVANAAGESYACLEVVPDENGLLTAESIRRVVHWGGPVRSLDPLLGRQALALIVWREGRPALLRQIVHFNLAYERVLPEPGRGVARHLFP